MGMHTTRVFVTISLLTTSLLGMAAPAIAADLSPAPVKAPAMVAAAYNWTGFYVGVHGGGGWNKFSGVDPTDPTDSGSSANGSGAVAGGQIGGNYQIGQVVLGLEGTYAWSDIKVSDGGPFGGGAGLTVTLKNDYLATVAGRLGYAFDRVLIYGKGGAAFTRDRLDANNGLPGALAGTASGSFDRTGWVAGAGVEWAFLQNWSVKAEYNFMRFGNVTEQPTTAGNLAASPAVVNLDVQTAVAGINYRF
jgi:outer membrane immunogenic protein